MVSTRSALKRPNDDAVSPTFSKRAQTERKQPRSLMDLPAEVRCLILKELLSLDTPIEYLPPIDSKFGPHLPEHLDLLLQTTPWTNGRLHVYILRTCKQLYLEGAQILYNNTINFRIGEPYEDPRRVLSVMGRPFRYTLINVPSAVKTKISRIHVQIFAHHQRGSRLDSALNMAAGAKKLTIAIRSVPAWKHIEIEVLHVYKSDLVQRQPRKPLDNLRAERALNHWRYIRNRSSVSISGIEGNLVSALRSLMVSTEPFVDLDSALGSLNIYIKRVMSGEIGGTYPESRDFLNKVHSVFNHVCVRGARRGDSEMFIRGRTRVMSLLNDCVLCQEKAVFRHDLPSWDVGPTLSVPANSNNLLEPMDEESLPLSGDESQAIDEEDDEQASSAYDTSENYEGEEEEEEEEGSSDDDQYDDPYDDPYGDQWGEECDCDECMDGNAGFF